MLFRSGWEIEFPIVTGQAVMTTRSVEYALECYRRNSGSCIDQHHVLDYNFDTAVVYNTEQVSGYLNLNLYPKNDVMLSLQYPKLGANLASYDILFSKEEQKYRFNQFWDITKDRGEFTGYNVSMFNTSPSGYKFDINPNYVNYDKDSLQRKKFRHNVNRVFLRKTKSDNVKILFKISNQKLLQSPR